MFYYIEPEVAGGLGPNSIIDTSVHPPMVKKLNYQFDGWLGDHLLESSPCFIVSQPLREALEENKLTGFQFDEVQTTTSEQFKESLIKKSLPKFFWLKVVGKSGKDDFGIAEDHRLVVSDKVIALLRRLGIQHADVVSYKT